MDCYLCQSQGIALGAVSSCIFCHRGICNSHFDPWEGSPCCTSCFEERKQKRDAEIEKKHRESLEAEQKRQAILAIKDHTCAKCGKAISALEVTRVGTVYTYDYEQDIFVIGRMEGYCPACSTSRGYCDYNTARDGVYTAKTSRSGIFTPLDLDSQAMREAREAIKQSEDGAVMFLAMIFIIMGAVLVMVVLYLKW